MGRAPTLYWVRRDLRLSDNAALVAALSAGGPVIPVFIRDPSVDDLGAAPKWRLGLGLQAFSKQLEQCGSRLILRSGPARQVLQDLIRETGARAVHWARAYDPDSIARDTDIKSTLANSGVVGESHPDHILFEPWTVSTGSGGPYRVYTPYWRAVRNRDVDTPVPAPSALPAPADWPASEGLENWHLGRAMQRGAGVCQPYQRVGEAAALSRLQEFKDQRLSGYVENRNLPAVDGCSGLSENLALGEISPRQCWQAGLAALQQGDPGAETWLKELAWREFAYHLMFHTPHILTRCWREEWDAFPWREDPDHPDIRAWQQGRTGVPFVDAAMREMYVTGKMHNRARMIVGSYLTKHLMGHWRIGQRWFADCLTDWDPASNAMGWQWVAGCGPDASPYFRIFNPETQAAKFDPHGLYRSRWIAEGYQPATEQALSYFDAIPMNWQMSPNDSYPTPAITLAEGRARALAAYQARGF